MGLPAVWILLILFQIFKQGVNMKRRSVYKANFKELHQAFLFVKNFRNQVMKGADK